VNASSPALSDEGAEFPVDLLILITFVAI